MADAEAAATEEQVLVELEDGVLTLTLNRPVEHNALTGELLAALAKALKNAEKDEAVRVVVLIGAGSAFCAGFDEEWLKAGADEPRKRLRDAVLLLRRVERPVVAAINGDASGAGTCLALACDIKLCSAAAKLRMDFVPEGLVPYGGLTRALPRAMGLGAALEHALTGKPLLPSAAERAGLVNRSVASGELRQAVRDLCDRLVRVPPRAAALTKRAMNRAADEGLEEHLDYEAGLLEILAG